MYPTHLRVYNHRAKRNGCNGTGHTLQPNPTLNQILDQIDNPLYAGIVSVDVLAHSLHYGLFTKDS